MSADHPGLIAPYSPDPTWTCEQCNRTGASWVDRFGDEKTVLTKDSDAVRCNTHRTSRITTGSREITFADLGAVRATVIEGGAPIQKLYIQKLYIWNDMDLGSRLVKDSTTSKTVEYRYLRRGGPRLELHGEVIALGDAMTLSSTSVPRGEGGFTHTLPVKSQYLHLVDREKTQWLEGRGCWEIWFHGRASPAYSTPPTDAGRPEDGVVVWPRKEYATMPGAVAGWRRQMVGAAFSVADTVALVTSRKVENVEAEGNARSFDAFEVAPWSAKGLFIDAAGAGSQVRYLALGKREPTGIVERGALPLRLPVASIASRNSSAWVGIDFGTANTVAAYQFDTDANATPVNDGVTAENDSCFYPSRGAGFGRGLEDTLRLFSGWWHRDATNLKPMQGTLLFGDSNQYSIVPPSLMKMISEPRNIQANLKWQGLATYDDSAVRAYLERVLLPAFHELVAGGAQRYRFVATYPLAFGAGRKVRLEAALISVLDTLDAATKLERTEFRLISESHAGTHAVPALQAKYSLVLDMGGGTTDLAFIKRVAGKPHQVLMAESLRIGGRDLLRAVLQDQSDAGQQIANAMGSVGGKLSVSQEVAIESLLGLRDAEVRLLTGRGNVMRRQRIAALLSGIIVTAVNLVLAALGNDEQRDDKPKINVFLLGQGWHLLHDGLLPEPFTEAHFFDCLQRRGDTMVFQPVGDVASPVDRKLALVKGALKLAASGETLDAATPRSYAGMDLDLADGGQVRLFDALGAIHSDRDYADGDPGIGTVIDDLVTTMGHFATGTAQLGTPADTLNVSASGMSVRDRMIRDGMQNVLDCRQGGEVVRSPLTAIVDGAWLQFWSPRAD